MPQIGTLALLLGAALLSSASPRLRIRRQLFREQVLPHSGGKIPEDAFRTDRLALNRLNKEGIAIPDGVLLEARHRETHFGSHRVDPDIDASIIRLIQRPDGRYAPPEGRYAFNNLVESTYVIRPPVNIHTYGGLPPRKPVKATLELPARPFFANDDDILNINNLDNLELINTLAQEFPGTRLWTGFGPLFHETTNRILRHSGAKQLPTKRGDGPSVNQLTGNSKEKELQKINHQTLAVLGARSQKNDRSPSNSNYRLNALLNSDVHSASLSPATVALNNGVPSTAISPQSLNKSEIRTLQLVNGILTPVVIPSREPPHRPHVQPLRPGPALKTHLTAPPLGYPSLERIPNTAFDCSKATRQMESDPQTNCQVFHLCHPDGRKESFLCPSGSRYDAKTNLCSPWTNVSCPADT